VATRKGARTTRAAKTAGRAESGQRARLKAKLSEAIEQVDEEGLLFLLRQANVLIHNQKVDDVNRELAELSSAQGRRPTRGRAGAPAPTSPTVTVEEAGNGSAFFLDLGGVRKALNLAELRQLVRICYGADSKSDALRQLFTVLARERSDILNDAGIRAPSNPLLEGLFQELRSRYHLEDR
jgi:hypothetical protein